MLALYREAVYQGIHHQPDPDAQGGYDGLRGFAQQVLAAIPDRPISFEVFSDEFDEMERQAREIATWGEHVYVKIPVTNTRGAPATTHPPALAGRRQGERHGDPHARAGAARRRRCRRGRASYVSVFAGRIADTGRDPVPLMTAAVDILRVEPHAQLIWASPRELLNIFQADAIGCHIITVTHDILKSCRSSARASTSTLLRP